MHALPDQPRLGPSFTATDTCVPSLPETEYGSKYLPKHYAQ